VSIGVVIKGLLDEAGISYKQSGKSFITACPRCFKRDKVYIRKTDGRFVCWVCKETEGFSGAPEWVLTELLHLPVQELRRLLYGDQEYKAALYIDLNLTDFFDADDDIPVSIDVLPAVEPDPGFRELDSPAGEAGRNYLLSRGVPLEIAKEYGIKAWPAKNRIVFPCMNKGKLLGWQDRYIGPTKYFDEEAQLVVTIPKALTSYGLQKDRVLLFGDRITGDHAILTEGPFDAIKAHLCGGNVCTMGKAVSKRQLTLLRMSGIRKLYLALDPDAFEESARILIEMSSDMDIYDMRPPEKYEDIGAMPMEEVRDLMRNAQKVDRNFLFLYLKDHYDYLAS
jgi:hypothetical protein